MADIRKAGEIIDFTVGEYSDYRNIDILIMTKTTNLDEEAKAFIADAATKKNWSVAVEDFVTWLITHERAVPLAHDEINIGEYGAIKVGDFVCNFWKFWKEEDE